MSLRRRNAPTSAHQPGRLDAVLAAGLRHLTMQTAPCKSDEEDSSIELGRKPWDDLEPDDLMPAAPAEESKEEDDDVTEEPSSGSETVNEEEEDEARKRQEKRKLEEKEAREYDVEDSGEEDNSEVEDDPELTDKEKAMERKKRKEARKKSRQDGRAAEKVLKQAGMTMMLDQSSVIKPHDESNKLPQESSDDELEIMPTLSMDEALDIQKALIQSYRDANADPIHRRHNFWGTMSADGTRILLTMVRINFRPGVKPGENTAPEEAINRVHVALLKLGWQQVQVSDKAFVYFDYKLKDNPTWPKLVKLLVEDIEEKKRAEKQRSAQEEAKAYFEKLAKQGPTKRPGDEASGKNEENARLEDERRRNEQRQLELAMANSARTAYEEEKRRQQQRRQAESDARERDPDDRKGKRPMRMPTPEQDDDDD